MFIIHIIDTKYKKTKKINNTIFANKINKYEINYSDLIIISTPTLAAKKFIRLFAGKFNLLVEKPISTDLNFIKKITKYSTYYKKIFKTGYNLRFDDGISLVKKILEKKEIGNIYYIKNTYANGTAKTNSNQVGSLLDMATHSINLMQFLFKNQKIKLLNNIKQRNEIMKKKIIDNGYICLKIDNCACFIHHGFCTWKNQFELEISGSKGFIKIISLSKWGDQKVILGKRTYPSGIQKMKQWLFKKDNLGKTEGIYSYVIHI